MFIYKNVTVINLRYENLIIAITVGYFDSTKIAQLTTSQ